MLRDGVSSDIHTRTAQLPLLLMGLTLTHIAQFAYECLGWPRFPRFPFNWYWLVDGLRAAGFEVKLVKASANAKPSVKGWDSVADVGTCNTGKAAPETARKRPGAARSIPSTMSFRRALRPPQALAVRVAARVVE